MKRILSYSLCALMAYACCQPIVRAEPPRENVMILRCVYVLVLTGTACLAGCAFKCLKCSVERMMSNHNWMLTNSDDMMPPLISGSTNLGPMTIQSASGIGRVVFKDECVVDLQEQVQAGNRILVATLRRDGTNVATLSSPLVPTAPDGDAFVRFDFRPWTPPTDTNCPPVQFLRLLN